MPTASRTQRRPSRPHPHDQDPGLLEFTHDGEASFIVTAVNSARKRKDLLVNEMSPHEDTLRRNGNRTSKGIATLEIKAAGAWTAISKQCGPLLGTATIHGVGDQVLKPFPRSRPSRHPCRPLRRRQRHCAQLPTRRTYGDLLLNEIGVYQGKALLSADPPPGQHQGRQQSRSRHHHRAHLHEDILMTSLILLRTQHECGVITPSSPGGGVRCVHRGDSNADGTPTCSCYRISTYTATSMSNLTSP
ncbi:hypothetical protein AB0H88_46470 [Nonomuraea sp. NPDC050680]|uniref:hypothetical protein n=1 Tax=Nonomuraea sp. NPDC050680 TaxID=3154630 RepID=UPI0033FC08E2